MKFAFTYDAMKACEAQGHVWTWRPTWGDVGFQECWRCGAVGPVCERSGRTESEMPAPGDGRSVAAVPPDSRDGAGVASPPPAAGDVVRPVRRRQGSWEDAGTGRVFTDMASRDEEWRRLFAAGVSQIEIATRFGVTSQRVSQVCRRTR